MSDTGEKNKILKAFLYIAGAVGATYLFYKLYFLRHPDRNVPHDNKVFVSPANGKVISVRPFNTKSVIETKDAPMTERGAIEVLTSDVALSGKIISVRLQVTDVHYQRAPTAGQVISVDYKAGKFENAVFVPREQGMRYENEHNSILIQSESGIKYKVVQIAGVLARTIECSVVPFQIINQGDFIGVIKLGSQVTIALPDSVDVTVKEGDTLIDGETVIAKVKY